MSKQEHYRPDLPWKIDGCFDAEITVSISTADDFEIAECSPLCDNWTQEEIERVYLMHAAPEMLEALIDIATVFKSVGASVPRTVQIAINKATPPDFTSAAQDARPSGGPKA